MRTRALLVALLMIAVAAPPAWAADEEPDSSLHEQLKSALKKKYFSVGLLFQGVFDYQPQREGGNGLHVDNARLRLGGWFDYGIGYYFQVNLVSSRVLLDARATWRPMPELRLDIGFFKTKVSAEFELSPEALELVNRARLTELAPQRQMGFQLSGEVAEGRFFYAGGIFNGNGFGGNMNDSQWGFMYTLRLGSKLPIGKDGAIALAVNAAWSRDEAATFAGKDDFKGIRLVAGGDLRFTYADFFLSAEVLWMRLNPAGSLPVEEPLGIHVTAGYAPIPILQVVVRWDSFSLDGADALDDQLIAGLNVTFTSVASLQLNAVFPLEQDIARTNLLANAQILF